MGTSLRDEYDLLVRKAAAKGITRERGRTPRDHMESLIAAGPWIETDVRRLTRLVEDGLYARSEEAAREGLEICRRLSAELPRLKAPAAVASTGEPREVRGSALTGKVLLYLVGTCLILGLAVSAPTFQGGVIRNGGRGGLAFLPSDGSSPWTSETEKASVRALTEQWATPAYDARYEAVWMPEYQAPQDIENDGAGPGFNLQTGVDHEFENVQEPFTPPLNHHHRQFVFAAVDKNLRFRRALTPLRTAMASGNPPGMRHAAYVKIHLTKGRATPVPVPAPDSVVLPFVPQPGVNLTFVKDPADGLCVQTSRTGAFHLQYVTVTPSDYLMAPLPNVPVDPTRRKPFPLPTSLRREAAIVLNRIGWDPAASYAAKVRRLHAYFAGFVVAPLTSRDRVGSKYLTLALARKGTCGHRAMTFTVTANAAGIPARLVTNDIHAFAEVMLPNGNWRALEFRLLDNERRREPLTLAQWTGFDGFVGLTLFVMLTLFLATLATRSLAPSLSTGGTRAARRARRDLREGVSSRLQLRLAQITLNRLAEHFDVDREDRWALLDAVTESDMPPMERQAVTALLELEANTDSRAQMDRYRLREAYWSAKNTLRYLEGRKKP